MSDPLVLIARLATVFDELQVNYTVVGSIASSMYGVPRATQDVDFVAAIPAAEAPQFAHRLATALRADFYVDEDAIRDAVATGGSFNAIHLATLFKADVFPARPDNWGDLQIQRSRIQKLESEEGPVPFRVASPEDTILQKLRWFRLGGETSERQWRDVISILSIQGSDLDDGYLDSQSQAMGLADLLARARGDL